MSRVFTSIRLFGFVALLTAASGLAALGHQTVWFRMAVDVLGANTDTFARVMGNFFLGLALGAFLASRRPLSGDRPSPRAGRGVGPV